jgi:hypothetical protein
MYDKRHMVNRIDLISFNNTAYSNSSSTQATRAKNIFIEIQHFKFTY